MSFTGDVLSHNIMDTRCCETGHDLIEVTDGSANRSAAPGRLDGEVGVVKQIPAGCPTGASTALLVH